MKVPKTVMAAIRAAARTRKINLRKRLKFDALAERARIKAARAQNAATQAEEKYTAVCAENEQANIEMTRTVLNAANAANFSAAEAIQLLHSYGKSK